MTEAPTTEDARKAAGCVVLTRRGELGLTMAQAAARAGVNIDTLSDMENGRRWPWPKNVAAIASALDLDAGELQRIASGQPAQAAS